MSLHPRSTERTAPGAIQQVIAPTRRFAYLLHRADAMLINPPLASSPQRVAVQDDTAAAVELLLGDVKVTTADGAATCGDIILAGRPDAAAPDRVDLDELRCAMVLARERGAEYVGLSPAAAEASRDGQDLHDADQRTCTGGALMAGATHYALDRAMLRLGRRYSSSTAAILGATTTIGRTMAALLGERVERLVLVSDAHYGEVIGRQSSLSVAARICRHLALGAGEGKLARYLQELAAGQQLLDNSRELAERAIREGLLVVTADRRHLRLADVAVIGGGVRSLGPEFLPSAGLICDLRRPRAISRRLAWERPDLLVIDPVSFDLDGAEGPRGLFGTRGLPASLVETLVAALGASLPPGYRAAATHEPWHASCLLMAEAGRLGFTPSPVNSFQSRIEESRWDALAKLRALPRRIC